jgi:hypothetical protein
MKSASDLRKFPLRLGLLGLVAGLLLAAGCATEPFDPATQYNYNNTTGYPAVGLRPWNL